LAKTSPWGRHVGSGGETRGPLSRGLRGERRDQSRPRIAASGQRFQRLVLSYVRGMLCVCVPGIEWQGRSFGRFLLLCQAFPSPRRCDVTMTARTARRREKGKRRGRDPAGWSEINGMGHGNNVNDGHGPMEDPQFQEPHHVGMLCPLSKARQGKEANVWVTSVRREHG
jgi:hypothetical protein